MTVVVVLCSHSRLDGCVHSSVNKPGENGRVSYDSLTHSRLYCRDWEKKVGHELTILRTLKYVVFAQCVRKWDSHCYWLFVLENQRWLLLLWYRLRCVIKVLAGSQSRFLVGNGLSLADVGLLESLLMTVDYFGEETFQRRPHLKVASFYSL